jgi:hypothetical protein
MHHPDPKGIQQAYFHCPLLLMAISTHMGLKADGELIGSGLP